MLFKYDYDVLRKHVSFTFLTQMISCPRAALLGRVLRLPVPYKPQEARDRGVLVHNVLERAMLEAIANGRIMDPADYERYFQEEYKKNPEKIYKLPMAEKDLAAALQKYHNDEFGHKIGGDIKVEFELPENKIWGINVKGRVDLQVNKDVIDYKTKSKATGKKLESSKRLTKLQGAFYRKALETEGKDLETFQAHNLILKSKEVVTQIYTFSKAELIDAEEELEEMVENAIDVMNSGKFLRNYNDMYCPCDYYEYCVDNKKVVDFIKELKLPDNIY